MSRRLGATPGFFDNDPVVIDLSTLEDPNQQLDLPSVCLMLRTHSMLPVAVRGANEHQLANAHKAGLFEARDLSIPTPAAPRVETVVQEVIREAVRRW
jgi:septum site-determining protein MinC